MAPTAAYDEIADWYENDFLPASRPGDPIGVQRQLDELLGRGSGTCLEVGCGTGVHAAQLKSLGWSPVGVDLSAGMLAYGRSKLPVARADATRLPVRSGSVPAVVAMLVHTDMGDYPAVLREVGRVLDEGGVFIHVGVHPAFCGGFADRSDPAAVVIRPGYLDGHWTKDSWTTEGVRNRVGATHIPLPALFQAVLDAGLTLTGFAEGGSPVPTTLAFRATKVRP
ncbi:class I SAM-dependent methyltransferase [Actinoplanes sp. LDG1-06]|uniref:Class I SAM-dependent methyltransferase n=1 Tax=Paractinoplanes ovalisporus TaxID=2810368 RepID=A0ABS2ASQ3_9ACTN|nr:class I SAM-dependent methyltransferase [Actinoplanes ovalisporus]MBM2622403.1 class I SAM-dependent methyltransferase [Actinoplanes ovalisporus]